MRVEPTDFVGWGIFQPISHSEAILARPASMAQRRSYLDLLPQVRLVVCRRAGRGWFGSAASLGDQRIRLDGLAPLRWPKRFSCLTVCATRYDGSRFWFDELDMRHDPGSANYLRTALRALLPPMDLQRRGLTAEERAAYELNYCQLVRTSEAEEPETQTKRRRGRGERDRTDTSTTETDVVRQRVGESLSHAGADLIDYLERGDSFRVTFSMGGRRYTSSVSKSDLTVQVAGICLSGEDQKFDLSSLVGVLREGQRSGSIYEVGGENGMDEEEYWRVHPPRD